MPITNINTIYRYKNPIEPRFYLERRSTYYEEKILLIGLILSMLFCMSGCTNVINIDKALESPNTKMIDFEVVDKNFYSAILVDKNTKVMYYWNMSSTGGFTPIYNEDGSLKLYEE